MSCVVSQLHMLCIPGSIPAAHTIVRTAWWHSPVTLLLGDKYIGMEWLAESNLVTLLVTK